jgi:hypothetical protein
MLARESPEKPRRRSGRRPKGRRCSLLCGAVYYMEARRLERWREDCNAFASTTLRRWTIDGAGSATDTLLDDRVASSRGSTNAVTAACTDSPTRSVLVRRETAVAKCANMTSPTGLRRRTNLAVGRHRARRCSCRGRRRRPRLAHVLRVRCGRRPQRLRRTRCRRVTAKPVAVVPLPAGVPLGFHGNWIDDAAGVRS